MVDRTSALDGHYQTGHFGLDGETGSMLRLHRDLELYQVAIWPNLDTGKLKSALGLEALPAPGRSATADDGTVLRIEPLKCWVFGNNPDDLDPETGATLDLSHSRTHLEIGGSEAETLLNRLLPLDLRLDAMPHGAVASSAIHHVGVTLWRHAEGDEFAWSLFIPRGFAVSVWEVLFETATQFGVEVI